MVDQLPQLQRKLQLQPHQLHQSMMDPQVTRRTFEAPLIVKVATLELPGSIANLSQLLTVHRGACRAATPSRRAAPPPPPRHPSAALPSRSAAPPRHCAIAPPSKRLCRATAFFAPPAPAPPPQRAPPSPPSPPSRAAEVRELLRERDIATTRTFATNGI